MGSRASLFRDTVTADPAWVQTGAFISVISCSFIVLSYLSTRKGRRHPNPLMFWKSVTDLAYAMRFQYNWDAFVGPLGCRSLATLTQFCVFSSECWFISVAFDLYQCVTNPFTNLQQNMRLYHLFSWVTGMLFAAALWLSNLSFRSTNDPGGCFIDQNDTGFLLVYYCVVVLSVLCAILFAIREAQSHSFHGAREARKAKRGVIRGARVFTVAYTIYQLVLISLWVTDIAFLAYRAPDYLQTARNIAMFLQTAKGFIDLVIWLSTNELPLVRWWKEWKHPSDIISSSEESSDMDVDLQPQLNVELRKEVLHFTTRGVVAASNNASKPREAQRHVVRFRIHELGMTVRFNDYSPSWFRDIRKGFGIKESRYRHSFMATCHERIQSGGSSGAFMFYTADYAFVVKSVTKSERTVLLNMLPDYVEYMKSQPESHLTRFYGCHSIGMYGQVFNFVVMGNAIGPVSMHEFYDLKGSWIDRNAPPVPPGKTVICTYCSHPFKYGSTEPCPYSIRGTHLPHVVLKDNDFHRKLRVLPETARRVVDQLEKDSNFLCGQGVMDYSLLLSVHSTKYVIDHTEFNPSSLLNAPTKRKVNHAICRPEDDGYRENIRGDVDLTPSSSEEEHGPGGMEKGFKRAYRYSIVQNHEDNAVDMDKDSTPLVEGDRNGISRSSGSFGTFEKSFSMMERTPWEGHRTIEKPGYKAYAVVGPDYYTIGVIDMLQTWTWEKRLERLWKVLFLRHDGDGISAAPPKHYATRFQRKMHEIMMVPNSGFDRHDRDTHL